MNKNIEVINEHLWAVNMQYVKAGYIKGLKLLPDKVSEQISLTNAGIIITDKSSKLYPALKLLFTKAMTKTADELQAILKMGDGLEPLDKADDLMINVVGWEIKRRCVRAEYLQSLSQSTFMDKFKIWIRKKVMLCPLFKQE
jgi:hypothetical protein